MLSCTKKNDPVEKCEITSPSLSVLSQHPSISCLNDSFTSFIEVFGVYVTGSAEAPPEYVLHTANVLAQYIDNNEDGVADDPAVLDYLVAQNYIVPVWNTATRESFWNSATGTFCEDNISMAASLYYDEDRWAIGGIEYAGTWDSNLEEVWHVVSRGWYSVYPEYFGEELNNAGEVIPSKLTEAMDTARGGQFLTIPETYPETAWYKYYGDCPYVCQAHEYFYWILMANIDALSPSLTNLCPNDEWSVCTQQELQTQDPLAFQLLNQEGFQFPTNIPDGCYR